MIDREKVRLVFKLNGIFLTETQRIPLRSSVKLDLKKMRIADKSQRLFLGQPLIDC